MKKIILASALTILLASCTGSSSEGTTTTVDSTSCAIDSMCVKSDSTCCDTIAKVTAVDTTKK